MNETGAEIRRIESEIAKNEAERIKLIRESEEVGKRLSQKWYSARFLIEAVVGGIVVAALMTAWGIGYLQPILLKRQEVARLKNELLKVENRLQAQRNERETEALTIENESIKKELASLLLQNETLQKRQEILTKRAEALQEQLRDISSQYAALAQQQELTSKARDRFSRLAKDADLQTQELQDEIQRLQTAQKASATRSEQITRQLNTRAIRGTEILIVYGKDRASDAKEIASRLRDLGANVSVGSTVAGYKGIPHDLSYEGAALFEAAQQVKSLIADLESVNLRALEDSVNPILQLHIVTE